MNTASSHSAPEPPGRSTGRPSYREGKYPVLALFPYLLVAATILAALSGARHLLYRIAPEMIWLHSGELHRLLDVNGEGNLIVWFTAGLWLILGLTATGLGVLLGDRRMFVLSAVGFLASMDETASIHESFNHVGWALADRWGLTVSTWPWVFFGAPVALAVVLITVPLLRSLPTAVSKTLIIAGLIFLTAVLFLEAISGLFMDGDTATNPVAYVLVTHAEEYLEMVAISLALSALVALTRWDKETRTVRARVALSHPKD